MEYTTYKSNNMSEPQPRSWAWDSNMYKPVQAQAYITIIMEYLDGSGTKYTFSDNPVDYRNADGTQGIEYQNGYRIRNMTHARSYDPMSIELPSNVLTFDIINYGDIPAGVDFLSLYTDYVGQPIRVTLYEGFVFGGITEQMKCGVFNVDTVSLSDDIITVEAVSALEQLSDEIEIGTDFEINELSQLYYNPCRRLIPAGDTSQASGHCSDYCTLKQYNEISGKTYSEISDIPADTKSFIAEIDGEKRNVGMVFEKEPKSELSFADLDYKGNKYTVKDLIGIIRDKTGLKIEEQEIFEAKKLRIYAVNNKPALDLLHECLNYMLVKCVITREDSLRLAENNRNEQYDLLMLNTLEKPVYQRSKALKNLRIEGAVAVAEMIDREELFTVSRSSPQSGFTSSGWDNGYIRSAGTGAESVSNTISINIKQNLIASAKVKCKDATGYDGYTKVFITGLNGAQQIMWSTDEDDFILTGEFLSFHFVKFVKNNNATSKIGTLTCECTSADFDNTTAAVIYENPLIPESCGATCDIKNALGIQRDIKIEGNTEINLSAYKVFRYYSNRDIYTLVVRGNPALDVGDYVRVSLTDDNDVTTYKRALVLSVQTEYEGYFRDTVKVRIIENEFEPDEGVNTHQDIMNAGLSHAQLAAYTHDEIRYSREAVE